MGFSNFFKPKRKPDSDAIIGLIQKIIFPGGFDQIDREVDEVVAKLNYRYPKKMIADAYLHASLLYFNSKDKEKQPIIDSITLKTNGILAEEDASTIYRYLFVKNSAAELAKIFEGSISTDESPAQVILGMIEDTITEFESSYKPLVDAGRFEAILFNVVVALNTCQNIELSDYDNVEQDLLFLVMKYLETTRLAPANEKATDFVNDRLKLYTDEINQLLGKQNYIPIKTYRAFYVTPLKNLELVNTNLTEIILFSLSLFPMIRELDENIRAEIPR